MATVSAVMGGCPAAVTSSQVAVAISASPARSVPAANAVAAASRPA
jgi:hypothetical protein